jgi:hypothetical protein
MYDACEKHNKIVGGEDQRKKTKKRKKSKKQTKKRKKYIIFIYSQYIHEGLIPIALTLEELGKRRAARRPSLVKILKQNKSTQ